jgi:hypothetical protein
MISIVLKCKSKAKKFYFCCDGTVNLEEIAGEKQQIKVPDREVISHVTVEPQVTIHAVPC